MSTSYLPELLKPLFGTNSKIGPACARTAYLAGPDNGCLACYLTPEEVYGKKALDPVCAICYARKKWKINMPSIIPSRQRNLDAARDGSEQKALLSLARGMLIRILEQGDFQSPEHIRNTADAIVDRELQMVGVFSKTYRLGDEWRKALKYFMERTGGPMMFSCSTPYDIEWARELNAVPVVVIKKSEKEKFIKWPSPKLKPLSKHLPKMQVFPCPNQVESIAHNNRTYYCSICRLCAPPKSKHLLSVVKDFGYQFALGILQH